MGNKEYNEFGADTPSGTDLILFEDSVSGALNKVTIDDYNTAVGIIKRVKITKTFADFTNALSPVQTINSGFFLPAKAVISDIFYHVVTGFSGGTLSNYTITHGKAGNNTYWPGTIAAFTTGVFGVSGTFGMIAASMSASTEITLTATSTGGNLSQATLGSVEIWIYYSVLD